MPDKISAVCKGYLALGSGCGLCKKCAVHKEELAKQAPASFLISERELAFWEAAASAPDLLEIIRLARVGLVTERHGTAIDLALRDSQDRHLRSIGVAQISPYERAIDALKELA